MKTLAVSPLFIPVLLQQKSTLLGSRVLLFLSQTYYILFPLTGFYFSADLRVMITYACYNHLLNIIYKSNLTGLFFLRTLKFSFSGKGHKLIFNNRFTVTFNFGHSHIYYLYNYQTTLKLTLKIRGYFIGLNSFLLKQSINSLRCSKPINPFTGRGVRFSKQLIHKKVGKVSMYM